MTQVMRGVRILEVAQHTFIPAAGAVQFEHAAIKTTRVPQASEHTEAFLVELGLEWERIESLKSIGAIT